MKKYSELYSGSLCNLFKLALVLASFGFARYTVSTSPNKDETAVRGYGRSLWVLVVLMSRKGNFFTHVSLTCSPGGGGALHSNRLMGMCRWMGSHFHDWIGS